MSPVPQGPPALSPRGSVPGFPPALPGPRNSAVGPVAPVEPGRALGPSGPSTATPATGAGAVLVTPHFSIRSTVLLRGPGRGEEALGGLPGQPEQPPHWQRPAALDTCGGGSRRHHDWGTAATGAQTRTLPASTAHTAEQDGPPFSRDCRPSVMTPNDPVVESVGPIAACPTQASGTTCRAGWGDGGRTITAPVLNANLQGEAVQSFGLTSATERCFLHPQPSASATEQQDGQGSEGPGPGKHGQGRVVVASAPRRPGIAPRQRAAQHMAPTACLPSSRRPASLATGWDPTPGAGGSHCACQRRAPQHRPGDQGLGQPGPDLGSSDRSRRAHGWELHAPPAPVAEVHRAEGSLGVLLPKTSRPKEDSKQDLEAVARVQDPPSRGAHGASLGTWSDGGCGGKGHDAPTGHSWAKREVVRWAPGGLRLHQGRPTGPGDLETASRSLRRARRRAQVQPPLPSHSAPAVGGDRATGGHQRGRAPSLGQPEGADSHTRAAFSAGPRAHLSGRAPAIGAAGQSAAPLAAGTQVPQARPHKQSENPPVPAMKRDTSECGAQGDTPGA
ncbi:unnamed protein product [Nyctereutes procyonoides]|uniref:(raccoon dog) hypothetical protein n=1 Tax=Nyctereutes procyonoides TaxID=34880 RepID=A0A811YMH5_NYCPR|nr:unnamed protein product [Nyctereutes procyonoides]